MVITQNCDARRSDFLSLCQIDPYLLVTGQANAPKGPKQWQSLLTRTARINPRFFYLPASSQFGIMDRLAVDLRVILTVPREDLEALKDFRMARLNQTASEHLRESLAHFFRRYAYDEWYPLTSEEFEAYAEACPELVEPYPWQKPGA